MFIRLINCETVHIYNKSTYVYAKQGVYVLDETCTQFVQNLRMNSEYEIVIQNLSAFKNISYGEAELEVKEILSVVNEFFEISDYPNTIKITGEYEKCCPLMLQISLTNRCIHQCVHCLKSSCAEGNDFDYDKLNDLINEVGEFCQEIEFTGGEPLLYKNITNILEEYAGKIKFNITTSGFCLHKYRIEDLKKFNLIQVSLQGSTAQIHDAFVGVEGSFDIVTNNIKKLCENNINLIVSRTITKVVEKELEDYVKLCISLGVKCLMIGIVLPLGRANINQCVTPMKEYVKLDKTLKKIQEKYSEISLLIDDETYSKQEKTNFVFNCVGGRLHWYISEVGEVYPCTFCQFEQFSIGNVVKDPQLFQKIVNERAYEKYNDRLLEQYDRIVAEYMQQGVQIEHICANIKSGRRKGK